MAKQRRARGKVNPGRSEEPALSSGASLDGLAILDAGGTYVFVNEDHARIYGYDNPRDLIGQTWKKLYGVDELRRFEQEIMPAFRRTGRWHGEAAGLRRDGFDLSSGGLTRSDPGCQPRLRRPRRHGAQAGRETAADALRESEERFRTLADTAPCAIFIYQGTPSATPTRRPPPSPATAAPGAGEDRPSGRSVHPDHSDDPRPGPAEGPRAAKGGPCPRATRSRSSGRTARCAGSTTRPASSSSTGSPAILGHGLRRHRAQARRGADQEPRVPRRPDRACRTGCCSPTA